MKVELVVLASAERLNRSVQEEAIRQFQKLERYVPEAAQVDLRLELIKSHRKGKTHYAHVAVAIPGEPRTFHAEAIAEDFRTALDRIERKAEAHLRRWHDKRTRARRDGERKGRVTAWLQATLSAPSRLLNRIRRR
ncbi:HPF/RaiA family ribosome-associated protein [Candidatus Berkelbacteria bacterium]|nr:HPF/RaiA family ribosome-associated protein [Candidatus Berkelbacteria bacterium]